MEKKENLTMFDHDKSIYVRIKKSDDGKFWERWVSTTKKKWTLDRTFKNFKDALKTQDEIINSNYLNFYKMIMKK